MILEKIKIYSPARFVIVPDKDEIYQSMGYKKIPTEQIVSDVKFLIDESLERMKIRCGYVLIPKENFQLNKEGTFSIDDTKFHCGEIIYTHLKNADQILLFLATLGYNFDRFSKSYFDSGKPYKGYLVDTIGSVTIETALDWMMNDVETQISEDVRHCTNRFSPGYCNWDIKEQEKLFSFFPNNFLNVDLLPSQLMRPMKTVSGIMGLGRRAKKMQYTCHICDQENCIMRKHQHIIRENV